MLFVPSVALRLLTAGLFHVLSFRSYCCVWWILPVIVITSFGNGSWLLCFFFLVCGLCIVYHGLFALLLGVIGRLCPVIPAFPGYLLYYY